MRALVVAASLLSSMSLLASPVEVDWMTPEAVPAKAARPFSGFLSEGSFLFAGGSDFVDGVKVYAKDVFLRSADGKWSKVGELPGPVAEGVSCATAQGLFCAGGTDGATASSDAFLVSVEGAAVRRTQLPALPEPVVMGAAAADGAKVYVVASKNVYMLDLAGAKNGRPSASFPVRRAPRWLRRCRTATRRRRGSLSTADSTLRRSSRCVTDML